MISKVSNLSMIALASLSLAATSASAVTVSLSANAPTEDIFKSQVAPGSYGYVSAYNYTTTPSSGYYETSVGQGFSTVGAESQMALEAVTFLIGGFDSGVQGKDFAINVYLCTEGEDGPLSLISSQAGELPASLSKNYITFALDESVVLDMDKYYMVEFAFTEPTGTGESGDKASLRPYTIGAGVDNTVGGKRWLIRDDTEQTQSSNGLVTYIAATPIPEASSFGAVGGIVAIALLLLRKRLIRKG
ncbi:PEP-CTERM sorting domain-containing protein [Ruficoccus amylovorans]|uniref:PEP-CTERM sorting domain-containing protein n=1 Tax=Ruficoccus amylovorans TaxID=1804625 RepID=A0A842HBT5_9BACT|nr:PEP-CTERM sorting domain-containing protein [Ruficoccus amylovorans]MBC2592881.1 PEP-CTERM sorting domain-containing protein [Ruficoccus amylovorans]